MVKKGDAEKKGGEKGRKINLLRNDPFFPKLLFSIGMNGTYFSVALFDQSDYTLLCLMMYLNMIFKSIYWSKRVRWSEWMFKCV
jgi:hypothetical protein